ncbi:oxidized purine nucleoside triphosphate hydrolase [Anabrus simplex]|uniref:oxidized purine nucleoside triphosphate hydrolase n=1 Tax=Anabrus simplex TaxID=316456 RepID=UPI0035A3393D
MKGPPLIVSLPMKEEEEEEEEITDESQIPSIRHSLIFLRSRGSILLVCNRKTRMMTGIGGSLDPGETPYDAAARYLYDYGMVGRKMKLLGLIELTLNNGKKRFHVHVLSAKVFFGRLRETEDSVPIWVRYIDIPYRQMPEDYCIWLPLLLQGLTFKGAFRNRNKRLIQNYKISVVYRGVERNRQKKFGRPPCYRWQGLGNDDSVDVSNAFCEDNPYDFNIMDELSCDDKSPVAENIDIFSEMKSYLDEKSEDDCVETVD